MIIIVVAHRLSTLKNIDEIFLLDDGNIVDSGNMTDLYNGNEQFKIMCNNQNIYLRD
jgi:ABC-type multidrug transport system fused ATPase/permease subunit